MDKIVKFFPMQLRGIDEEKGIVEAVVSSETIDRYGEIIKADAYRKRLKQFMKHPVLVSSHRYSDLRSQIGVWEKVWIEDNQLVGKAKYFVGQGNEEADWGFFLAKNGVAAFSVGFLPYEYEDHDWDEDVKKMKKPCRTYTDVELLEVSQVIIPANPTALQRSLEDEDPSYKEYAQLVKGTLGEDAFQNYKKLKEEEFSELVEEDLGTKDLEEELITKPDTESYIHIGVPGEEGKHGDHQVRTITIGKEDEGIKAHYCVDDKKIIGYMFDTEKWDRKGAEKWVEDHTKEVTDDIIETKEEGLTLEEEHVMEYIIAEFAELKAMIKVLEDKLDAIEAPLIEEKESKEAKKKEDDNYIKKLLEDTTSIAKKLNISVQS